LATPQSSHSVTDGSQSKDSDEKDVRVIGRYSWQLLYATPRIAKTEYGDIRVGVFPELKEILVRLFCLPRFALHSIGSSQAQACHRSYPIASNQPSMSQNLLELGCGLGCLSQFQ